MKLFYSYAHEDEPLRQELEKHLSTLRRQRLIDDWHDRKIGAGDEWKAQIDKNLDAADVILLLVSADFLTSDYCWDDEMKRTLERHAQGTARVIPVILRHCDWNSAPFGKLQAFPTDARPVTDWLDRDAAWNDIAQSLRKVAQARHGKSSTPLAPQAAVVPQGLRSFDADDKDFFLQLLPGPYHADGLPESLHFWKRQIERTDPDETFRVGVIYGRSGCGKSSWIKAGLLPRLDNVTAVYIEATPKDTPARLLAALRKRCEWLKEATSLADALQDVDRIPSGTKLLVVLDQFEQWLHGRVEEDYGELLAALGGCDGAHVQCMLLIRSDFWDLLTRFLRKLDVRQEEDKNLAMFDLFDKRHARHVLALFGQAYGALPKQGDFSADQESFLTAAVEGLAKEGVAEDGRIVCVRLSLFAEMLKRREWTPATLKQIGGPSGWDFEFLEENFSSKDAPRPYRHHEGAARAVLECLLPPTGTEIKGVMRSEDELRQKSGYERKPDKFVELLKILNQQLRLITPTVVAEDNARGGDASGAEIDTPPVETKHYQLTHDYLVPSLRAWLTAKQRETWRGKAFLLLAERTTEWTSKPRIRALPGPLEYVRILASVLLPAWPLSRAREKLSPPQRRVLWASTLWYGLTGLLLLYLALRLGWLRWESNGLNAAQQLVYELNQTTDPIELRSLLDHKLTGYRRWVIPELTRRLQTNRTNRKGKLSNALRSELGQRRADEAIALVRLGVFDESRAAFAWRTHGDPEALTQFVFRAPSLGVTAEQLAQLYEHATAAGDVETRFAVLLTLGNYERSDLADRLKLAEVYANDPSSAIHSSAGWLLDKWKQRRPSVSPHTPSADGPDWCVLQCAKDKPVPAYEMTFVRIRVSEKPIMRMEDRESNDAGFSLALAQEIWLSDREVTQGLFQLFVDEVAPANSKYRQEHPEEFRKEWKLATEDRRLRRDLALPVEGVSWEDAVRFCNWLSWRENRKLCYRRSDTGAWTRIVDAEGYRLPSELEWEFACRAGSVTQYGFGSEVQFLEHFAVFGKGGVVLLMPVGTKLPNMWGLHDMHGNIWEWCDDLYRADSSGVGRVCRGGCGIMSDIYCRSAYRYRVDQDKSYNHVGFRVALGKTLGAVKSVGDMDGTPLRVSDQTAAELKAVSDVAISFDPKLGAVKRFVVDLEFWESKRDDENWTNTAVQYWDSSFSDNARKLATIFDDLSQAISRDPVELRAHFKTAIKAFLDELHNSNSPEIPLAWRNLIEKWQNELSQGKRLGRFDSSSVADYQHEYRAASIGLKKAADDWEVDHWVRSEEIEKLTPQP